MSEEEKAKGNEPEDPEADTGEGDQPEATKVIEQQSERIKELEAERDKRIMDDAKKQMHGTAEGGQPPTKPKETPEEYGERIMAGE